MMEYLQDQLNLASRSLTKNLSWSASPLTEMNDERTRLPGEVQQAWPGKTVLSTDMQMQTGTPAVHFYQPENHAESILRVIEKLERIADDTVVPSYGSANKGGPAGKTMGGLSMLRSDSARKLKLAIQNIDMDITMPSIQQLFTFNMRFIDDDTIKGDCNVKSRGAASLMAKEQLAVRRTEYLQMVVQSPVLTEIHGKKGIAYIASESLKSIEMDLKRAIPGYEEIEKLPDTEPMQPQEPQGTARAPEEINAAGQPNGRSVLQPNPKLIPQGQPVGAGAPTNV
jgi:hypothetical protein